MSFCYVLMCHTDPAGVLRLVRRVRSLSPGSEVLVRFRDPEFLDAASVTEAGGRRFVSRIPTRWGDQSLVDAALEGFSVARALTGCDHAVLVSGQDYPIRDLADWEAEVDALGADALLDASAEQPADHELRWSIITPPAALRGDEALLRRATVRLGAFSPARVLVKPGEPRIWVGVPRGSQRPPLLPVKCAQWITLSAMAIDALLHRDHADPRVGEYFRGVRIPDEWTVPSIVCDDPSLRVAFAATTAKVWEPWSPSPRWLDLEALERIRRTSAAPFARKIAPDVSPEVLAEADRMATRSRAQVAADVVEPVVRQPAWADSVRATVVPATGVRTS
ncbi:hypothetical protein [Mobilicoccus massiliensis]|uniref:hypothetical protein n=1 Tax=Mobilicoccus massiliensis TaxID=1522310 RepID=UPI00058C177E|nr:hypothetical protein [Mobilicoccus massiliensis]